MAPQERRPLEANGTTGFTTRQLPDFIDHGYRLLQIDEQPDSGKLVVPLEERYRPDLGRPAELDDLKDLRPSWGIWVGALRV